MEKLNNKIAVLILNWNGVKLLEEFIPNVIKFSKESANIYVVDNDSSDDSIVFLKDNFPQIKIIQNEGNFGFTKGYNEAIKQINEEIICLLNSDIEVTENWLNPIIDSFKKEGVVAVQPKVLDYNKRTHFEYAGAGGGLLDKLGYPFCRGRVFFDLEEDIGQYNDEIEIEWASGCTLFFRTKVYKQLGGLDEDYFAHQEEIDLCWRARNAGYKVLYNGKSTVYHVGGATLDHSNPKKTFLNFRNSLYNLLKNSPKKGLFWRIYQRMVLDFFSTLFFIFQGKFSHGFSVLKAHFSFYSNFRKIYNKRPNQILEKNWNSLQKLIVFEYFIMKKTKYSDLIKTKNNVSNPRKY